MHKIIRFLKSILISIMICCFFVLSISGCIQQQLTTYRIRPEVWKALSDKEPEESLEVENDLYALKGDYFCTSAYLDEQGYVIIILNEEQKELWRKRYIWHYEYGKKEGVIYSHDFSKITFESSSENLASSTTYSNLLAVYECAVFQILDGRKADDVKVQVDIIDYNTKKKLFSAVWPDEEFKISSD